MTPLATPTLQRTLAKRSWERAQHLGLAATSAVLVASAVLLAASLVLPERYRRAATAPVPAAYSGSNGALIAVVPAVTYAVGDQVAYRMADGTVAARKIIQVYDPDGSGRRFATEHTSAGSGVTWLPESTILGQVRLQAPLLGYALAATRSMAGMLLLLVAPAALLALRKLRRTPATAFHGDPVHDIPVAQT